MNRTAIEWTDWTWNPVTGCRGGCEYCYARAFAQRFNKGNFEPEFHADRLDQPLKHKKAARVFLGSVTDMFGEGESSAERLHVNWERAGIESQYALPLCERCWPLLQRMFAEMSLGNAFRVGIVKETSE